MANLWTSAVQKLFLIKFINKTMERNIHVYSTEASKKNDQMATALFFRLVCKMNYESIQTITSFSKKEVLKEIRLRGGKIKKEKK